MVKGDQSKVRGDRSPCELKRYKKTFGGCLIRCDCPKVARGPRTAGNFLRRCPRAGVQFSEIDPQHNTKSTSRVIRTVLYLHSDE